MGPQGSRTVRSEYPHGTWTSSCWACREGMYLSVCWPWSPSSTTAAKKLGQLLLQNSVSSSEKWGLIGSSSVQLLHRLQSVRKYEHSQGAWPHCSPPTCLRIPGSKGLIRQEDSRLISRDLTLQKNIVPGDCLVLAKSAWPGKTNTEDHPPSPFLPIFLHHLLLRAEGEGRKWLSAKLLLIYTSTRLYCSGGFGQVI